MKILGSLMVIMIFRQAIAGIIRKPPAFSTPVYSNSYLPAAMQVIFHAVEQLKLLQTEEIAEVELVSSSSTSTIQMPDQQPQSTTPEGISIISTATTAKVYDETTGTPMISASTQANELSSQGTSKVYDVSTEISQRLVTSTASVVSENYYTETPEVNEETTESNYELPATPETNHEFSEPVQVTQESNQEVSEESEEKSSNTEIFKTQTSQYDVASQQQSTQASVTQMSDDQKKKDPTVDSVVSEIYGIVKTTTSLFREESDNDKSKIETSIEKSETVEDEEEETRFCLLGERVAQVPRPSLNHYLRRSKVPPRPSLQQLANLYDALSKDARKQGFARFGGYTDEVLTILYSSAEGGVGPQLKQLLEKVVERNELTRDDAKIKTSQALHDLDDPASALSKDLRHLLPLRYTF